MSRAELKIPATCVFWRTEDGWRGECVELAATSVGHTLVDVQARMVAECYRVGAEALDRGQIPARHPDDVSEEARDHLAAVLKDGASVSQQGLDEAAYRHVVMTYDIALQRTVSEVDNDELGVLRFVFIQSGKQWVAQCLEYDVGGEGDSPRAAADAAFEALMAQVAMDQVRGKPPLSSISKAPEHYWKLYEKGSPIDIDKEIEGTFRVANAA